MRRVRSAARSIVAVEEVSHRKSRLGRLHGNSVAVTVVSLLAESKIMGTVEIARAIGQSVPRTSNIRGALRFAELALPQLLRGIK
jgi:hypothetical protein